MVKISKRQLHIVWLVLLLFPFIRQRTYAELPQFFGMFYRYASIISAAVIFFMSFQRIKLIKKQSFLPWLYAFDMIYIVSTYIFARAYLMYVLYQVLIFTALAMLICIEAEKRLNELLTALSFLYGSYIYLNFITDIIFPGGLYTTSTYHTAHLLGDDNALAYVLIPGVTCMIVSSMQKFNRLRWYVWGAVAIAELTVIRVWAASAVVSMTLFIALLIYTLYIGKINTKILFIGVVAAIIICLWGLNTSVVKNFITNVLHKDITLHDRTVLWAKAMKYIAKSPLLGHGGYFQKGLFPINEYSVYLYPCHTPFLQILIDGGILLFAVFSVMTLIAYLRAGRKKQCISNYILAIGLSCMLINYITEHSELYHYMIIVMLMAKIQYFKGENPKKLKLIRFRGAKRYGTKAGLAE